MLAKPGAVDPVLTLLDPIIQYPHLVFFFTLFLFAFQEDTRPWFPLLTAMTSILLHCSHTPLVFIS